MPVSGLVVALSSALHLQEEVLTAIAQEPRIEVGVREATLLAIVVDTRSSEEDRQLWQWLQSLPGVEFVEVAMVGFE